MTVTLYSKPSCQPCIATKRALTERGITFMEIDVEADLDALASVMELGYRQAPVVGAGEQHWSGFRPDLIAKLEAV